MKTFLGIDFGTTQTSVSMIRAGSAYEPEIVEIDGKKTVDTALRLDAEDNVLLFGHSALERIHETPEDTFYNFKPAIGSGDIFKSSCKEYSPETLALIFLKHLRQKIEKKYFNVADLSKVPDLHCTIGCPAAWNEKRRGDLAELAEKAGFPNVSCCDEPFGVIYYYHFRGDLHLTKAQNILVYDFGGGTTDLAIEEITPSPDGSILGGPRVLAATGIPDLGGKDFDEKLRDHFIEDMGETTATFGDKDSRILEHHAKLIKEMLSISIEDGVNSVEKVVPMLFSRRSSHRLSLTKNEFERICGPFIERMEEPVYDALKITAFEKSQVDNIILAGGSSRLYYVKNKIKALFPESDILVSLNPVEVIAKGLALYGRSLFETTHTRRVVKKREEDIDSVGQETPVHDRAAEPKRKFSWKWLTAAAMIAIAITVVFFVNHRQASQEQLPEVQEVLSPEARALLGDEYFDLGINYKEGNGVTQDNEEAYVNFYLAYLYENTQSKKEMDILEGKGIFNFRKISKEQVERAQRKAIEMYK